ARAEPGPRQVPLLTAALSFDDDRIVAGAAEALGLLGRQAQPARRALARQLKATNPAVRSSAALALWQTDRRSDGIDILRDGLKGQGLEASWSGWALARMGGNGAAALPEVVAVLGDASDRQREWAFILLPNFGERAVPHLRKALESTSPRLCLEAVEALGQLGPLADAAVPDL